VIRRSIAFVAVAGAFWPGMARAQAPGEPAPAAPASGEAGQAEALFNEAKALRDGNQYAEACPKFAASRSLASGVGVTLYLADCYEKIGKTQSAWTEFRNAEQLARDRGDKRADVAAERARALESKLNRVTLATAPLAAGQAAPVVTIDGVAVPPEQLNTALAMDPGEHELKIVVQNGSPRVLAIHVDPNVPSLVVPLAEPEGASPALATAEGSAAPPAAAPEPAPSSDPYATRRWVGLGLIAAGAGAAGIGTWLLTSKVTGTMADGSPCDQRLRSGAQPAAGVLFAAGGVAAITGIVLVVTSARHTTEIAVAPLALPGGGGAFIGGAF
jgi:hypothetical protein